MFNDYVETLPIAIPVAEGASPIVEVLISNTDATHALEAECCGAFRDEFRCDGDEGRIVDWLPLPEEVFVSRASALIESFPAAASELARFQKQYRARQVELLQSRLTLERQLAALVEDAYGLTPEERKLLRDTRPIRDPIDVLEAKIAGQAVHREADTAEFD